MNLQPGIQQSLPPNPRPARYNRTYSFVGRAMLVVASIGASLALMSQSSFASELLFSQYADGQSAYGPSEVWPATGVNSEVADDFNVVANIDRVVANTYLEGSINFQGVYVRFYQFGADNKPGPCNANFNQFVSTRARFTSDGQTAYVMSATATGDNNTSRSFVYSLNAGNNAPPQSAASLRSTSITLSANVVRKSKTVTVTGRIMALNQNGAAAAAVTVVTTWKMPNGSIQGQNALTNKQGMASFNVKGGTGTYTLTVTSMKKTAYTFDAANSVLSRNITK